MNINGRGSPNMQVLRANQTLGPLLGIFTSPDGRNWTRVNSEPVRDSLEDTIAEMRIDHAVHSPNAWLKIVDQKTGHVLHDQAPEVPHEGIKQFFPPVDDEVATQKRNEWLAKVMEWVLPESYRRFLMQIPDEQKRARVIRKWYARNKIEVQTHESGATRVMRDGEAIAEWRV